jgi:hypothetical protein
MRRLFDLVDERGGVIFKRDAAALVVGQQRIFA